MCIKLVIYKGYTEMRGQQNIKFTISSLALMFITFEMYYSKPSPSAALHSVLWTIRG